MSYKEIIFEKDDKIGIITLNRPDRLNAWTWTMGAEMHEAIDEVENDPNLRVSIITGAGRGFCAGADLGGGSSTFDYSNQDTSERRQREGSRLLLRWYFSLKKPVIVAINGPAVGVGVTMILPFDIRIAAESARVGIVFNRRGIIPEIGCPWLLPRIVGISKAAEIMYTGKIYNSKEALEMGLVSRVVPDDKLMDTARDLANEIAVKSAPVSVALTKWMLYKFLTSTDLDEIEKINHVYFGWVGAQPDSKEGVVSFLQKRDPEWKMKVPDDVPDLKL